MRVETPDDFFLRNGGAALLAANGTESPTGLVDLFSRQFLNWPKEDGSRKPTRFGTAPLDGIVRVWEGRLDLRSAAAPENPGIPGVTVARGVAGMNFLKLVRETMDLPRPFLFLTVGASYRSAVEGARLTIDPRLVECNGSESFVLDSEKVQDVRDFAAHFGMVPLKLRDLKVSLEQAVASGGSRTATFAGKLVRHPFHAGMVKRVAGELGFKGFDPKAAGEDQVEDFKRYWTDIARLPPSGDKAWEVAQLEADEAKDAEAAR